MRRNVSILMLLLVALAATACTPNRESRIDTANKIASRANFSPIAYRTDMYDIQGWQASDTPEKIIRIYIEGYGFAWRSATMPSSDPTPTMPNALSLATTDGAAHVLYLARPCQYMGGNYCRPELWTSARFSEDTLASYMQVLDQIKTQRRAEKFELVGFSGGGDIAALLAATRDDVASLRTVSTPIDTVLWARVKRFSPLRNSLNPAEYMPELSRIPQIHFWGENDTVVPYIVLENYNSRLHEGARCSKIHTQLGVSHGEGWEAFWPQLLALSPECHSLTAGLL